MEFSTPNLIKQGNNYGVSYGDDSGLYVVFSKDSIPDAERTLAEGRPCFKDIDVVTINMAGSTSVVHRPVNFFGTQHQPSDVERFAKQWQAYKNQEVQAKNGMPLEEWPLITKSQAAELKSISIFTVEDLVACPDGRLTWMGARELREKAKLYIEQAKGNAPLLQLQAENDRLRNEFEAFKKQVSGMQQEKQTKKTKEKLDEHVSTIDAAGGK